MRISHSRESVQVLQVPAKYTKDSLLISVSNARNPFLYFLMKHTVWTEHHGENQAVESDQSTGAKESVVSSCS